jgi:hypothetical protein
MAPCVLVEEDGKSRDLTLTWLRDDHDSLESDATTAPGPISAADRGNVLGEDPPDCNAGPRRQS